MFELGHSGDMDDEREVLLLMVARCAQHSVAGSWYGGKIFRVGVGEINRSSPSENFAGVSGPSAQLLT